MIFHFTHIQDMQRAAAYLSAKHIDNYPNEASLRIIAPKLQDAEFLNAAGIASKGIQVDSAYQLSSKKYRENTSITVNGARFSQNDFQIIAGPCSVEDPEQIHAVAAELKQAGLQFIRGGAYKPRSSPYSFTGLGLPGLQYIREAANAHGLAVVTELLDLRLLDEVYAYTDIIQVGARNMSNFYMLTELGKQDKPVLLKRGMQARTVEWLLAADYILQGGNESVILCERGIRSFDPSMRNVMDVNVIPLIQQLSHLPIIADPSHGTGEAALVPAITLSCVAAGANGIMLEVHPNPEQAKSDSKQALTLQEFKHLLPRIQSVRSAITPMAVNI